MSTYLGTALERAPGESVLHLLHTLFASEFEVVSKEAVTGHVWDLYDSPENDSHMHLRVHNNMVLVRMHDNAFDGPWVDLLMTLRKDHRLSCLYVMNDTAMALGVEVFEAGRKAASGNYEQLTTGINGQGQDVLELDKTEGNGDILLRLEDRMKTWFYPQGLPNDGWEEWVVRYYEPHSFDAENGAPEDISDRHLLRAALNQTFEKVGLTTIGEDTPLSPEVVAAQIEARGMALPDLERAIQTLSMGPDLQLHQRAAATAAHADMAVEDYVNMQIGLALLRQRKPVMSFPVRISHFASLPTNVSTTVEKQAPASAAHITEAPAVEVPQVDDYISQYARPVEGQTPTPAASTPTPEPAPTPPPSKPAPTADGLTGAALRKARRTKAKLLISEGRTLEAREQDPEYDAMCFLRDEASKNVLHPLKQLREYPAIAERLADIEAGGQVVPELSLTVRRIRQLATPDLAGYLDTLRPQADARREDGLLIFNDYLEVSLIKTELHRRRKALDAKKVRDRQNAEFRNSGGGGGGGLTGWEVLRAILIIIGLLLAIARLLR